MRPLPNRNEGVVYGILRVWKIFALVVLVGVLYGSSLTEPVKTPAAAVNEAVNGEGWF